MDLNLNVNVKLDAAPTLVGCINTLATVFGGFNPRVVSSKLITNSPEANVQTQQPVPETESSGETMAETEAKVETVPESKEITDEQLRAIVGPKSKEHGKEKVFAILDEFGVKGVPDLKQDQRQAFIEKVNAL